MKLADFKDEEALILLEKILDPVCVIASDAEITTLLRKGKKNIFLAQQIIKKHKREVVEIIAAMHKETPETIHFTLPSLIKDIMDIIDDPDLDAVFQSQGQKVGGGSSGSALASIMPTAQ